MEKKLEIFSILIIVIYIVSTAITEPTVIFAQSAYSPTPTQYEEFFDYRFPDGYYFRYAIAQYRVADYAYAITLITMDNPYPIEISFYEKLPNGTENHVTHIFPMPAYGSMCFSTSYPMKLSFTELTNQPTATPSSSINITPSPTSTIPEFPFVTVFSLFVVIPLITILVKKRIRLKFYNLTNNSNIN